MKMFGNSLDRTDKERLSVRRSRSNNVRPFGDKSRGSSRGRLSNSDLLSALSRLSRLSRLSLVCSKAVKLAEENVFMRKEIIKLREETREEEDMDNDHEDLNDKEDLFEILIAEMEKNHEKKSNPSSDVDLLQTETRPSSPPLKTIPTRHPDDELLLVDSDDENYSSGTDDSLDERESL